MQLIIRDKLCLADLLVYSLVRNRKVLVSLAVSNQVDLS